MQLGGQFAMLMPLEPYLQLMSRALEYWWIFLPVLFMAFVPRFVRALIACIAGYVLLVVGSLGFTQIVCSGSGVGSACGDILMPSFFMLIASLQTAAAVFLVRLVIFLVQEARK